MAARFHPGARVELDEEADRLIAHSLKAFTRFANAVDSSIDDVLFWPEAYPIWPGSELWTEWEAKPLPRSHAVPRHNFRIVYIIRSTEIAIVAVAATKRRPEYWRERGPDF